MEQERTSDAKLARQVADGGRLRALVLELWQRTRMDWGFVTDRLATTFRRDSWLGAHDRRFVGEALYGMVRHLRRIDLAIARGRRVRKPPRDLERLLALLVLERLIEPAVAARVEPELDWRLVATIDEVIALERRPAARIAMAASLPDWLAERIVADHGDRAEALALALNRRAPMTVRANLLVGDRDALVGELAKAGIATTPGRWSDTALHLESRTNLFALDAFKRGALEAQDEGSQLLADLAAAQPGKLVDPTGEDPRPTGTAGGVPTPRRLASLVVDLCAGAGGKTLAIAARLGNRGRLVAGDVDAHKLDELRKRARRAQVSNAQAIHIADGRWPRELDALRGKADVVLVDAPCSGIGALRRNPEARWRLREADLASFTAKQRDILATARELAAPRGRIVYATCSLLRVENQDVVAAVGDLVPIPLTDVWPDRAQALGDGTTLMVTPSEHGTDGFFAAILEKPPTG